MSDEQSKYVSAGMSHPSPSSPHLKALEQSLAFFEHRDRMNAVVHLGETRWSPITRLVREAVEWSGGRDTQAEIERLREMAPIDLDCGCEGSGEFVAQECSEDRCSCAPNCEIVRYCDCIHGVMVERSRLRAERDAALALVAEARVELERRPGDLLAQAKEALGE